MEKELIYNDYFLLQKNLVTLGIARQTICYLRLKRFVTIKNDKCLKY